MTREEAINNVKSFIGQLTEGCQESIRALVPELAESEDERIRKYLIWIVENVFDSIMGLSLSEEKIEDLIYKFNGIQASDILAWLEKQKDINCLACDQHLKGYLAGRKVTEEEKQKEQDQPITGNSLEQEWLRYVDKRKKEDGGELPILGEYGWLRIARHFAEWQKAKMMEEAVEGEYGYFSNASKTILPSGKLNLKEGDKVRILILKAEEE